MNSRGSREDSLPSVLWSNPATRNISKFDGIIYKASQHFWRFGRQIESIREFTSLLCPKFLFRCRGTSFRSRGVTLRRPARKTQPKTRNSL
jgi:hypothetical protein